ncbi:MAG: hypothetical protein ACI35R_01585 [Bacillus sp. (in: firmicutes)]
MSKEKFYIPMPDEQTIQSEIKHIVAAGVKQKESFPSYLNRLYKQIGIKNLLPTRWEEICIILSVMAILIFLSSNFSELKGIREQDLYAFTFLISPLLYMTLSVYHFAQKVQTATFEVEMVCKYNLYQIAAFRMLALSVISIFINSISIFSLVMMYDDLNFFRALIISITSLFLFSILFLFVCMKKQSVISATLVIGSWIVLNFGFRLLDNYLFEGFLMKVPILVYVLVLLISISIYIKYLSKLVYLKSSEGVQ